MIEFFGNKKKRVYVVQSTSKLKSTDLDKLHWLFNNEPKIEVSEITEKFYGPRSSMVSPWSTNAVEITRIMGIEKILRIEEFFSFQNNKSFDPMLFTEYAKLDQNIFENNLAPEKIKEINDINLFNIEEGLALSLEEIKYLERLSNKMKRKLTDSEVFGFSQVNSEHCRHKIFNGQFLINKKVKKISLFEMIKKTSRINPNSIISAYKDNVAFIEGPEIEQFAPIKGNIPSEYVKRSFKSVISIKAETHNFPTTVEAFNGSATGSGGEIRDRLAGGRGSLPLSGSAVYMTSYTGLQYENLFNSMFKRKWLYQSPRDILTKASNGASDFGNKFGQPLINGSILTFEHKENETFYGYDKVIMLAGGIGFGKATQSKKFKPKKGDKVVIIGGDNYRIGMGGAAVSSSNTGKFKTQLELNAVQRSNPEMQKRVSNAIRSMIESSNNPIVSIHDHGAGGHLNCLSELLEECGGKINIDDLPIGDSTLSYKEIIGNESQERMGLIISSIDIEFASKIARRERAPFYVVGEVTGDNNFSFYSKKDNHIPLDINIEDLIGNSPKTIIEDQTIKDSFKEVVYDKSKVKENIEKIFQLESVGSKDWLTNKVDRCVTGKVAQQQCIGELQLPLSNYGLMALDYNGKNGVATSIGHSPLAGLIDPKIGSVNSIAKSLTNIIWVPLEKGLESVSLSANWMWPCKNKGEDDRLYKAVKACSTFAINLGINIPTGKDSLSMTQKYDEMDVLCPGTVIISAAGNCPDINKIISPVLNENGGDLYYIDMSNDNFYLGGSAFAQVHKSVGKKAPTIKNDLYFKKAFNIIQKLIIGNKISSGHDVGSGGLITTLMEMCFPSLNIGMHLDLEGLEEKDTSKIFFSEKIALVIQSKFNIESILKKEKLQCVRIGSVVKKPILKVKNHSELLELQISKYRKKWMDISSKMEQFQTKKELAKIRAENIVKQPLKFKFPSKFSGFYPKKKNYTVNAAVLREKGSNSEREMAYIMDMCGFKVRDVHMTDIIEGREDLKDINFLVAVGGFSNSDVLGSAKGWAGAFKYNPNAKKIISDFFNREDTLTLGVCNGCQLFIELGLINLDHKIKPKMEFNNSGKFECIFSPVQIKESSSIMMKDLEGSILGIWSAHGEGKFSFPYKEKKYQISGKYYYEKYPSNPNGSDFNTAMLCSKDGRHLVMMPHLERSTFPWNWGHYPETRKNDTVSPWVIAFENAYEWLISNK
jgi:phosphoribosylformylglycinamidine synthase